MTTEQKVQVIAEYDGWEETGKIHPFDNRKGKTYRKAGLIGVQWISSMAYLTSLDWLHPVAMKVLDSIKK